MDPALRQKIDRLPLEPGCYLMKDRRGEVVYVGKAASLRARVRSYFERSGDDRLFVPLLEDLLGDVAAIVTRSEKEAVLLENELVKKHKPRFNVRLRDDKDFIVLRLDPSHPYPRLEITRARQRRDDGARYFGPYSSASSIRETLRVVNRHFQLRTCTDHVLEHRRRPCILHQIQRCPAPCVYQVPAEEYRQSVEDAVAFLEGRETDLVPRLRSRMAAAAAAQEYEKAARLRDQLQAVQRSLETQRVLMGDRADRDVFGLYREGPALVIQVLAMRGGKLQDSRAHPFSGQEFPDRELLSSFLPLYYERAAVPDEVLLPVELEGVAALAEVLSDRRGRRVRILAPQRGARKDLLEVAARNAAQSFRTWRRCDQEREEALVRLTRALRLHREPRWMECYDISAFQGALAVGSGVSFRDGEPDKAGYRRYKVKGTATRDDFAMLHEVVGRRLRRAIAEGAFPDLLVIDGGKGQLGAALAAARDLGVPTRPSPGNEGAPFVEMVGLAKSRLLEAGAPGTARSPERVFLPGRKDPLVLRQNSAELFLLTRLRDEAHRFAVDFHRALRRARTLTSVLEDIPGVGAGRRRALLRHFGSLKRVREATPEEIARVEGLGPSQARAVWAFFRQAAAPATEADAETALDAALAAEAGKEGGGRLDPGPAPP